MSSLVLLNPLYSIYYHFRRQQRRYRSSTLKQVPRAETTLRRCLQHSSRVSWKEGARRTLAEPRHLAVTSSKSRRQRTKHLQGNAAAAPRRLTEQSRYSLDINFSLPRQKIVTHCMYVCVCTAPINPSH